MATAELSSFQCADPINLVESIFRESYQPDPILAVSEWADQHRILSQKEAEPGRYRTSRTPYLREIMDCLSSNSPITQVCVQKGAQLGFSDAGNNFVGYVIDAAPGRLLLVQPTVDIVKKYSKGRIQPMINDCPRLKDKVKDPRSRDSGNTVQMKEFPGGELIMVGANSAAGLRSTPARYIFLDEADAYPHDVEGEGDPVNLAIQRTKTFRRKKIYMPSTPTIQGVSRIEKEFLKSDQRYYFVPCPDCHEKQILKFRRENGSFGLRWKTEAKKRAIFVCEHCGSQIDESHKTWMLENGEWRPTAEGTSPFERGYHISSLYSPVGLGDSWTDIMHQWEAAQKNTEKLKTFVNTVLGETWVEHGDAPDWHRLYERREEYKIATVPQCGLFLTSGVDIQKDRIEMSVFAWGRGKESWLIEHRVMMGNTAYPDVWNQLSRAIHESWDHESGASMMLSKIAIDTGYATSEVYSWIRSVGDTRIVPVKGSDNSPMIVSLPKVIDITVSGKKIKRGIKLWTVGVSILKEETYNWLRMRKPTETELDEFGYPPGYIHFPHIDEEYFKQLTAESLVTRERKGFPVREWQKDRERNEALDCRIYARAAASVFGMDRFNEDHWQHLESQFGNSDYTNTEPNGGGEEEQKKGQKRTKRRRASSRSSYMR